MRVFISQPMRGKTDTRINKERYNIIEELHRIYGEDIEVIDSILDIPDASSPFEYLGESIKLLSKANVAVFAPDWREARGCRVEHAAAVEYGLKIIYI